MQDPELDLCFVNPAINVILGDNWRILWGKKRYDLMVEIANCSLVVILPVLFLEIEIPEF